MAQYYKLDEAAEFLTLKLERNFTRDMLIDSAARGEITLCARIEGNLEFSKIDQEAPTELQCFLKTLFKGYIKIPRKAISSNDQFYLFAPAKIVEIVDADLLNTPSAKKILLPNLCGQQVTADGETIPFQINRDDAKILEKDLLFFVEKQKPAKETEQAGISQGTGNIRGIDKRKVAAVFQDSKWDYAHWLKNLASPSSKLKDCRVAKGSKTESALWNPASIGLYLLDCGIPLKELDYRFNDLKDWTDEWKKKLN